MTNERIHMNTQAGSRLRQATAIKGKIEIGSQPIHEEPRATSAGLIPFVSLSGKEITLLQKCAPRRPLEADRHLCGQSCAPVLCVKNVRGSAAGCIRRWRNFPMKYDSPTGNSLPR